MAPADDILEVSHLTRRFDGRDVLRDLDLTVREGERVALTGSNGAGKSTLLRCVLGTVLPDEGSVRVAGAVAGSLEARRFIGATLSQERSFYLRLTGRQNLVFFASVRLGSRRAAARAVAALEEELELSEILAQRVSRCSTGMVQQLGFARALLGSPRLFLLDEPTRSLDVAATERLWAALERRREMAVLIATHRVEDTRRCDREQALGRPA